MKVVNMNMGNRVRIFEGLPSLKSFNVTLHQHCMIYGAANQDGGLGGKCTDKLPSLL